MSGALGLFTAFGAGILSFLSPCVAPLLPGYLTLISGSSRVGVAVGTGAVAQRGRMELLRPSVLFVLGFSLVFVTLGASVSVFGDQLDAYRQIMTRMAGVVMILMGFVILWGFHAPFLMRERRFHFAPRTYTNSEILLVGMAFGFGWTPCIGPILASILAFTSTAETVRYGVLLLTAYSFGLGLPFLLAGLGIGSLQRLVRWGSRRAAVIVGASGVTLIVVGLLFVSGEMARLTVAADGLMRSIGLVGSFGG